MSTATLIKNFTDGEFRGDAALFRVEPPIEGHKFVAASAVDLHSTALLDSLDAILGINRDQETMLFPADRDGNITSWGELAVVPEKSFDAAFETLDYQIV